MRKFFCTLVLTIVTAMPAAAQRLNLDFPDLADRADEVVDITLDASMLKMAAKFLGRDKDEADVREMIRGLEAIYVRSYEFGSDGQYDKRLAERIKSQLGPTWHPMVTVRSKTKENVNIYIDSRGGEDVRGLVIISADAREFTVVQIVGPIDIDRLASLEGEFGIPRFSRDKDNNHD
ncbi:MAG TPA: DUF4252 domain-containing protein [Thermoanaerobaculia bacterium]